MPNRLADSLSPYLLQHRNNPVDWYPWGDEAFELARKTDRPIFLSVGYAACHWCHVMEHESFENESIATFLNNYFVSIKVDREERPDVDQIYMNAVQVMTGRGGWPMSVFLDHSMRPFYAGTYWPPTKRGGMPGFAEVLDAIAGAWQDRRDEVTSHAAQIASALNQLADGAGEASDEPATHAWLADGIVAKACDNLVQNLDRADGGFGGAPKFPHATDLLLLLSQVAGGGSAPAQYVNGEIRPTDQDETSKQRRLAAELTLEKMALGGIHDHIGGGFARYSVDAKWLVPHFEKMLYDNGLLAECYLRGFQITDDQYHADVACGILDYLIREMRDEAGGFHSSEDADSEGVEGKYYVWKPSEVIGVLGEQRGHRFCQLYDITDGGNFEGASIPNLSAVTSDATLRNELAEDREKLRLARDKRVHPGRDDKVIVAWNGLAIRALAIAGAVLNRSDYVAAAVEAATFIDTKMRRPDGRLLHAFRRGTAHLDAYIDDYAFLADALVAVYQATADADWIDKAEALADVMMDHFWDAEEHGFYYTADDAEPLITRNNDWIDGSLVSGNGAAIGVLLSLADLTGRTDFRDRATETISAGAEILTNQSAAAASLVTGLDRLHHGNRQTVLAVTGAEQVPELRQRLLARYQPHAMLAWNVADQENISLAEGKTCIDQKPTIYRCENFTCQAGSTDLGSLAE